MLRRLAGTAGADSWLLSLRLTVPLTRAQINIKKFDPAASILNTFTDNSLEQKMVPGGGQTGAVHRAGCLPHRPHSIVLRQKIRLFSKYIRRSQLHVGAHSDCIEACALQSAAAGALHLRSPPSALTAQPRTRWRESGTRCNSASKRAERNGG